MPSRRTACLLLLLGCAARGAPAQGGRRRDTDTAAAAPAAASKPAAAQARPRLDLNTATAASLAKLPRMTPGLARKLVENRPYEEVRDLVNRNILPGNVYEAIKSRVEVNEP